MFNFARLPLLMILIGFSQPGSAEAPDVKTILDQLIQTYGGESNLRKMDSMVQEWDLTALMGNRHGTDTRSVRTPDQLRVDLSYPQKSETRILNGDSAFVIFGDAVPGAVSGIQRDAMRLQLMRLYSPLVLRDKIDSIGLVDQGGLLALSLVENGVHVHYMINREIWRIEKVAGSLLVGGREIKFLTEYSDFTTIDGVLVHQKENKFASDVNTAVLQLRNIVFDASIDDSQFVPSPPLGGLQYDN